MIFLYSWVLFHILDFKVSKWDDNGNDVIVLAKHMCMIMMEMTDFTRGKGRLKTTMDVITAAKGISEAGTKLDKLARLIADQCPESTTKKDLLAYLQRIALNMPVHCLYLGCRQLEALIERGELFLLVKSVFGL